MANYSIESKRWGLKKEGTRLTAESAPDVWFAVEPESEMTPNQIPIEDTALRGVRAGYPSVAGQKLVEGTVKMPVRAQNIAEFGVMTLGAPTSTNPGTLAYNHEWIFPLSSILPPAYTIFVDRGIAVEKYNGVCGKSLVFDSPIDGTVNLTAELMGIAEATGSIGSPSYTESEAMAFWRTSLQLAGGAVTTIQSWNVTINSGLVGKRVQNASQNIVDLILAERMTAEGSFEIFFESETERDKFFANTQSSFQATLTGDADGIEAGQEYVVDLEFPEIVYTGWEFGSIDNILSASVNWRAEYNGTKLGELNITNVTASY